MRISKREENLVDRAEGHCAGLPYTTDLVNSNGCHIHFWATESTSKEELASALHKARNARDIVSASWSVGAPTGFWANQDIK